MSLEQNLRAVQSLLASFANEIAKEDKILSNHIFHASTCLQEAINTIDGRVTHELSEDEREPVNEGDFLEAYRRFAKRNKCSLRVAKDRVDAYWFSNRM